MAKIGEKAKQPYAIGMKDDSMFAFAGLWESWKDRATGQKMRTYTILTTDPNELIEPIHNPTHRGGEAAGSIWLF